MIIETSTPPPSVPSLRQRSEQRALGILALGALGVIAWVSRPIGVGIFIGALTAFMLQPLYLFLCRRTKRRWLAQTICLAVTLLAVVGLLSGISYVVVARGTAMGGSFLAALEPGGKLRAYLILANQKLRPLGFHFDAFIDKLRDAASFIASRIASVAAQIAGTTFHALLEFFFMLLTTHFVLAYGDSLESFIEDLSPLSRAHTRSLLLEIRKVGKATLLGSIATGIGQGAIAYGIFALSGVPEPLFFGVATAVASLFPGVGTLLVWVPAGAYLIASGFVGHGIIELVLSAIFVIGFCDYVMRPRLVGDESMPSLLTFVALFGGVEAFGLIGLLMGPLLMSVAVAVLRLYRADLQRAPATDSPV